MGIQHVTVELTGRTVRKTVDIAKTSSNVTLRTVTVQLAVRRGTRLMFAKQTYVSNMTYIGHVQRVWAIFSMSTAVTYIAIHI